MQKIFIERYRSVLINSVLTILVATLMASGCAQRPFTSLAGIRAPWAGDSVEEEAHLADTLFEKRRRMDAAVAVVKNGPVEQQQKVANGLGEVIRRDPILLLRLHAVTLASELRCPAATAALIDASSDSSADIRIAAVKAWESMPAELAIGQLQEIIGSDTNVDVRLAATKALGKFSGQQAVQAISMVLDDPDPALQLRAMESLALASGENMGLSVAAWKDYANRVVPSSYETQQERVAKNADGALIR